MALLTPDGGRHATVREVVQAEGHLESLGGAHCPVDRGLFGSHGRPCKCTSPGALQQRRPRGHSRVLEHSPQRGDRFSPGRAFESSVIKTTSVSISVLQASN